MKEQENKEYNRNPKKRQWTPRITLHVESSKFINQPEEYYNTILKSSEI